ncbi:hypothetical protein [Streptomyces sp. NPDC008141]|uniref:TetR/AcrR family transcriptional regulator n=1 Tax=Streptomyces sp. NPDC008141 TaxID=3364815 RepID=UPI0036EA073B
MAWLVEFLGGQDATARATAVVTILGGLIKTRYLNALPNLATLTQPEARYILAPVLRGTGLAATSQRTHQAKRCPEVMSRSLVLEAPT